MAGLSGCELAADRRAGEPRADARRVLAAAIAPMVPAPDNGTGSPAAVTRPSSRRADFLAAAKDLFHRRGYSNTSIGRASWRERVCKYVYVPGVGAPLKK